MASRGVLQAFGNADLKGDRIMLPESILEGLQRDGLLEKENIAHLCFELSKPLSQADSRKIQEARLYGKPPPPKKIVYCSVREFTADENIAILPKWIMNELKLKENERVTVSYIESLKKGRLVKLQPHTMLSDDNVKSQLEGAFRDFTTLTKGTTIEVAGILNHFDIVDIKPENVQNGINILNTDLAVEFMPPLDNSHLKYQSLFYHRSLHVNDEFDDKLEINGKTKEGKRFYKLIVVSESSEIGLSQSNTVQTRENSVDHDTVMANTNKNDEKEKENENGNDENDISISIEVTPKNGKDDLDIYLSYTESEPQAPNKYDLKCVDHGKTNLVFKLSDIVAKNGNKLKSVSDIKQLYIGVNYFNLEASNSSDKSNDKSNDNDNSGADNGSVEILFHLKISQLSENDLEMASTMFRASSLVVSDNNNGNNDNNNKNKSDEKDESDSKNGNGNEDDIPTSDDPNKQFCLNCRRFVNKWTYDRHLTHCQKQFYFCKNCKRVFKAQEKDKHILSYHAEYDCPLCQESILGGKFGLLSHTKNECLMRQVACEYCHNLFKFAELLDHETMCGNRTELCNDCNQYIAIKEIKNHCLIEHNKEWFEPTPMARGVSMDVDDNNNNNNKQNDNNFKIGSEVNPSIIPDRDYEKMLQNSGMSQDNISKHNEKWICPSCEFGNRPLRYECMVCHTKKPTKNLVTISDQQKDAAMKSADVKNTNLVKKIAPLSSGDPSKLPPRKYDQMQNDLDKLKKAFSNNGGIPIGIDNARHVQRMTKGGRRNRQKEPTGKSSLYQSGTKSRVKPNEDVTKLGSRGGALGSGDSNNNNNNNNDNNGNGSNRPQRDYDAMLSGINMGGGNEDIDMSNDNNNEDNNNDNDGNVDDSTDVAKVKNIPVRNYDAMMGFGSQNNDMVTTTSAPSAVTDEAHNSNSNSNSFQLSSNASNIPQRDYSSMMKTASNSNDNSNSNSNTKKRNSNEFGKKDWLCSKSHLNKAKNRTCNVCGEWNPLLGKSGQKETSGKSGNSGGQSALGLKGKWMCLKCNEFNKPMNTRCKFCHADKGYDKNKVSSLNDPVSNYGKDKSVKMFKDPCAWTCDCKVLTWHAGTKARCASCGMKRPDKAPSGSHVSSQQEQRNKDKEKNDNDTVMKDSGNENAAPKYSHPLEAKMMGTEPWNCARCTWENQGGTTECEVCGEAKP